MDMGQGIDILKPSFWRQRTVPGWLVVDITDYLPIHPETCTYTYLAFLDCKEVASVYVCELYPIIINTNYDTLLC